MTALTLMLFVSACSNEGSLNPNLNDLNEKLAEFEKTINQPSSKRVKETVWTEKSVYTESNPYDDAGIRLLRSFERMEQAITDVKSSNPDAKVEDMKPYIDEQVKRIGVSDINFNEEEKSLYDSFVRTLERETFENGIEVAKRYEAFVSENYSDQTKVGNFLAVTSLTKFTVYEVTEKSDLGKWEDCVVDCMGEIYAGYNAVDWARFIATNPGANVLWDFASCGWDC